MSGLTGRLRGLTGRLRGVGLWTAGAPSFGAWVEGGMPADLLATVGADSGSGSGSEAEVARPTAALLHPRLRRRTSTLTRAVVTAIEAAAGQGGADVAAARYVLVSSFGEIETTVELLGQLAEPGGPVSPTRFHNSVHNTATGYLSIATGNHHGATALAGGPAALEIGLLEVLAGLAEGHLGGGGARDSLLVLAEERLPAPFDRPDADPTFAVALHLTADEAEPDQPEARGLDLAITLEPIATQTRAPWAGPRAQLASSLRATVPLLRAIAGFAAGARGSETVPLVAAPGQGAWQATLRTREP